MYKVHTIESNYSFEGILDFDRSLANYLNQGWAIATITHADKRMVATCVKNVDEKEESVEAKKPDPLQ